MNKGKEVFEILMRENADMLLAFLRASVRDSHAVDEMFQETMVVAWRRMKDFDRDRSFGKWLRGIARNLILAHYRKLGSNRQTVNVSSMDWVDEKFTQIQHRRGDTLSEKLSLLAECVEALSDENRNTIKARYMVSSSEASSGLRSLRFGHVVGLDRWNGVLDDECCRLLNDFNQGFFIIVKEACAVALFFTRLQLPGSAQAKIQILKSGWCLTLPNVRSDGSNAKRLKRFLRCFLLGCLFPLHPLHFSRIPRIHVIVSP